MRDWRTRLENWVRVWDRLPELTQDCFPVVRSGCAQWPSAIPVCAALSDFYARCDGGSFGPYTLVAAAELTAPAMDDWLWGAPGLEGMPPGRWVVFGNHRDHGHALFWDADADEVFRYSPDDEARTRLGKTMEQFLERLFHPSAKSSNESIQMWAAALAEADATS